MRYVACVILFVVIVVASLGLQARHARHLTERDLGPLGRFGWSATGCNYTKGRTGYRFATVDGRVGKICVGGGQHYRITVAR